MPFPPDMCGACLGPKTGTHPRFCEDCVQTNAETNEVEGELAAKLTEALVSDEPITDPDVKDFVRFAHGDEPLTDYEPGVHWDPDADGTVLDLSTAVITAYSQLMIMIAESHDREPEVVLGLKMGGRQNETREDIAHLFLLDPESAAFLVMGVMRAAEQHDVFYGQLRNNMLKLGVTLA